MLLYNLAIGSGTQSCIVDMWNISITSRLKKTKNKQAILQVRHCLIISWEVSKKEVEDVCDLVLITGKI